MEFGTPPAEQEEDTVTVVVSVYVSTTLILAFRNFNRSIQPAKRRKTNNFRVTNTSKGPQSRQRASAPS